MDKYSIILDKRCKLPKLFYEVQQPEYQYQNRTVICFFFFLQRQNESLRIKQIQFTDHCYINLSHRFTRYLLYDLRQTHTLEALVFLRNTLCKNYMKIPFKFLQTLATFYWPYQPQKALQYILWPYVRNLTKPGGRINMNIPTWQWPLQVLSNHHTEFNMGIKCSPPG